MANVACNGSVMIIPVQPRSIVTAHRALSDMEPLFDRLYTDTLERRYAKGKEQMKEFINGSENLAALYKSVLLNSAKALEYELKEMSPESRAYHAPILAYLSRASDAHSILPFRAYLHSLKMWLEGNGPLREKAFFNTLGDFEEFFAARVKHSIMGRKSASALLSSGMDCIDEPFDLVSIARENLGLHAKVAAMTLPNSEMHMHSYRILKMANNCQLSGNKRVKRIDYLTGIFHQKTKDCASRLFAEFDRKIEFSAPKMPLTCIGMVPLVAFFVEQTIGNAFKASFGARETQKLHGNRYFMYNDYLHLAPIEPGISIRIWKNNTHAFLSIHDSGIGMSKEMMNELFAKGGFVAGFANIKDGNHGSLVTFPHIADLANVEIKVESEIGAGTIFEFKIPLDAPSLRAGMLMAA
jgi:hypothetical protein